MARCVLAAVPVTEESSYLSMRRGDVVADLCSNACLFSLLFKGTDSLIWTLGIQWSTTIKVTRKINFGTKFLKVN